jgi:hypothetical protein
MLFAGVAFQQQFWPILVPVEHGDVPTRCSFPHPKASQCTVEGESSLSNGQGVTGSATVKAEQYRKGRSDERCGLKDAA